MVVRLCPRKRAVGSEPLRRGPRQTTAIVANGGARVAPNGDDEIAGAGRRSVLVTLTAKKI
jgi:hypothetical protein